MPVEHSRSRPKTRPSARSVSTSSAIAKNRTDASGDASRSVLTQYAATRNRQISVDARGFRSVDVMSGERQETKTYGKTRTWVGKARRAHSLSQGELNSRASSRERVGQPKQQQQQKQQQRRRLLPPDPPFVAQQRRPSLSTRFTLKTEELKLLEKNLRDENNNDPGGEIGAVQVNAEKAQAYYIVCLK